MAESSHPKAKGQASEAAVLHELSKKGIPVLQPFGDNERYDLVIDLSGQFIRLQVKTGRMEDGRVQFETRSSGTLTRRIEKESYVGDADFFAVYSPDLEQLYMVSVEDAPETTMGLRVEPPKKSSPSINWADEYVIDRWLECFDA